MFNDVHNVSLNKLRKVSLNNMLFNIKQIYQQNHQIGIMMGMTKLILFLRMNMVIMMFSLKKVKLK